MKLGADIDQLVELAEKARTRGAARPGAGGRRDQRPVPEEGAAEHRRRHRRRRTARSCWRTRSPRRARRTSVAAKFFTAMGGYAPTVGIIGTVVSLTHVLENLSNPASSATPSPRPSSRRCGALLSANFLWLPIGTPARPPRRARRGAHDAALEGILAVQAGTQPRAAGRAPRAMVPAHQIGKPPEGPRRRPRPAKSSEAA